MMHIPFVKPSLTQAESEAILAALAEGAAVWLSSFELTDREMLQTVFQSRDVHDALGVLRWMIELADFNEAVQALLTGRHSVGQSAAERVVCDAPEVVGEVDDHVAPHE